MRGPRGNPGSYRDPWIENWGEEPFRDAGAETDFVALWGALPEAQKQELGALFSRMVMTLFRVLSGVED